MGTPKPTFKKEPRETGLAAVGHPYPDTTIKMGGKQVGTIKAPFARSIGGADHWQVRLTVKNDEEWGGWGWIGFKGQFGTEEEARSWVKVHWDKITSNYQLHQLDE